jgi:3-oxoacyl-(acyl-carrier-protein) synthase
MNHYITNVVDISASEMALRDAGWRPSTDEQRDRTGVCIG